MTKTLLASAVLGIALQCIVPAVACDLTLSSGQDIQTGLNTSGVTTLCLNAGTYSPTATITMNSGQTLVGLGSTRDDVVINSTATSAVILANNSTTIHNLAIWGNGASTDYGVNIYYKSGVTLWGLRIQHVVIGTGVNNSSSVQISDTFYKYNGNPSNGMADPNVWIYRSSNVNLLYGELFGANNGPGGDGELGCYDSTSVSINGTHSVNSGASAFYFVNCDSSTIENTVVDSANEWGLDIVGGTDNLYAYNNTVEWAKFGGAVYDQRYNTGGQFVSNTFTSNNQMSVAACNAINVIGNPAAVTFSGNSAAPNPVYCTFTP